MVKVKRKAPKRGKSGSRKKTHRKSTPVAPSSDLSLPTERSKASTDLEDYSFLIYGEKKIGKTSLAARFQDAFHLFFEPGGKAQELYERAVTSWADFLGYIDLLMNDEHEFKTVVIDTGSIAYDLCLDYVVTKEGIKHPGDMDDYGASWSKVKKEFKKAHNLLMSKFAVVVIAHGGMKEIETRTGRKFDKIVPQMSKQCMEYYTATMDVIALYNYIGGDRYITIEGNDYEEAGIRLEKNFRTPDGDKIHRIPAGDSADEAYENLVKAFNNKQKKTYERVGKKSKSKPKSRRKK